MELTIKDKKENKVLNRTELTFSVVHEEAPPKRSQVQSSIANKLNTKPELVVVVKMLNTFGTRRLVGKANVYSSKEALSEYERKYLQKRWKAKEGSETEKKAEPKQESSEKKVEEKTEKPEKETEKKTEEKKEEAPKKKEGEE